MLVGFLHVNRDIFAWKPSDMPGVLREVTENAMKIRLVSMPVKQHLRRFDEGKRRTIGEEIAKLLVAGFIKEVYHPEWLANPILIQKRVGNGGCVLTTRVSIKHAQRLCFLYCAQTR